MSTQTVWTMEFCDGVDLFSDKAALCKHLRLEYAEIINRSLEQKISDLGTLTDDELVALVKDKVDALPIRRRVVWSLQTVERYNREPAELIEEPAPFNLAAS